MPDTFVWVVAVESHTGKPDEPSDLDIAAPVAEGALNVAEHFAALGSNFVVRVNVAQTGRHNLRLKSLKAHQHVKVAGARLQELSDSIDEARGYDCLVLYWVGHGFQEKNDRLLLTEDSRNQNNNETLDFSSLLAHWRDPDFPKLQIGFIDTCAQVRRPTSRKTFQGGGASGDQHFIFSASAGEFASTLAAENAFPQVVLEKLKVCSWPANGKSLIDAISNRLDELPGTSRPTIWRTIGSGDSWTQLDPSASSRELRTQARRAQVSVGELQHLFAAVEGIAELREVADSLINEKAGEFVTTVKSRPNGATRADDLEYAFQRFRIGQCVHQHLRDLNLDAAELRALAVGVLRHSDRPSVLLSDDMEGVLLQVLDCVNASRGSAVLVRMLLQAARLAAKERPSEARRLRDLLESQDWSEPYLAAVEKDLPPEGPAHLQISVRLDAIKGRAVVDDAWLHDGLRHQHLDIPSEGLLFSAQLNELIEVAVHPKQGLVVELLLPTQLLCLPKAWLEMDNELLGTRSCVESEWPVTVRWKDRLIRGNATNCKAALWKTRATASRNQLESGIKLNCSPPANSVDANFRLLGSHGPAPLERSSKPEFFRVLLEGHPFMSWPRIAVANEQVWIEQVRSVIENQPIDQVPYLIHREKQADGPLSELVLMIDEPLRNPFE